MESKKISTSSREASNTSQSLQYTPSNESQAFSQNGIFTHQNFILNRRISGLSGDDEDSSEPPLLLGTRFEHKLISVIVQTDFQSSVISLAYGNYKSTIAVLATKLDIDELLKHSMLGSGSYGKVYNISFDSQAYALKNIKVSKSRTCLLIDEIYKEYFICCLASRLQVGPKMARLCGYDIVVTPTSAFFVMEKCGEKKIDDVNLMQSQLRQCLKIMQEHFLVHLDIKLQNIAFSASYNKHVFIDFGLSRIINARVGHKTKTKFVGTLCFCSEQMKKAYILQRASMVDLYKNDQICLQKTLHHLRNKILKQQAPNPRGCNLPKIQDRVQQSIILVLRLKYCILRKDLAELLNTIQRCGDLPKCCNQILCDQSLHPTLTRNQVLVAKLNQIRRLLESNIENQRQCDELLYPYLNIVYKHQLVTEIMPIEQILKLNNGCFIKLLENDEWAYKIFVAFSPFFNDRITSEDGHLSFMFKIARKIADATVNSETSSLSYNNDYIHVALKYFIGRFQNSFNCDIYESIRMLFLCFDYNVFFLELQNEVLKQITNPTLRLLKILEYYLYCSIVAKRQILLYEAKFVQWVNQTEMTQQIQKQLRNYMLALIEGKNQYKIHELQSTISHISERIAKKPEFKIKKQLITITYLGKLLVNKRTRLSDKQRQYLEIQVYQYKRCSKFQQSFQPTPQFAAMQNIYHESTAQMFNLTQCYLDIDSLPLQVFSKHLGRFGASLLPRFYCYIIQRKQLVDIVVGEFTGFFNTAVAFDVRKMLEFISYCMKIRQMARQNELFYGHYKKQLTLAQRLGREKQFFQVRLFMSHKIQQMRRLGYLDPVYEQIVVRGAELFGRYSDLGCQQFLASLQHIYRECLKQPVDLMHISREILSIFFSCKSQLQPCYQPVDEILVRFCDERFKLDPQFFLANMNRPLQCYLLHKNREGLYGQSFRAIVETVKSLHLFVNFSTKLTTHKAIDDFCHSTPADILKICYDLLRRAQVEDVNEYLSYFRLTLFCWVFDLVPSEQSQKEVKGSYAMYLRADDMLREHIKMQVLWLATQRLKEPNDRKNFITRKICARLWPSSPQRGLNRLLGLCASKIANGNARNLLANKFKTLYVKVLNY